MLQKNKKNNKMKYRNNRTNKMINCNKMKNNN